MFSNLSNKKKNDEIYKARGQSNMIDITDVKNMVVIGAGIMGQGIAQVSLMVGHNVT